MNQDFWAGFVAGAFVFGMLSIVGFGIRNGFDNRDLIDRGLKAFDAKTGELVWTEKAKP